MIYTEGDLRAAVTAALSAVSEFGEDEQDELTTLVQGAVTAANTSQQARTGAATDNRDEQVEDVAPLSADDMLMQFVGIAREKKALEARDKALSKRKAAINARLLTLAEQATIMPPWKVDGATVYLTSRVWAKIERAGEQITDAERAKAIAFLKEDPDTAGFVKEDFSVQSLSSYFKEEVEHGRVTLDHEGKTVLGGALLVQELTEARVRGA